MESVRFVSVVHFRPMRTEVSGLDISGLSRTCDQKLRDQNQTFIFHLITGGIPGIPAVWENKTLGHSDTNSTTNSLVQFLPLARIAWYHAWCQMENVITLVLSCRKMTLKITSKGKPSLFNSCRSDHGYRESLTSIRIARQFDPFCISGSSKSTLVQGIKCDFFLSKKSNYLRFHRRPIKSGSICDNDRNRQIFKIRSVISVPGIRDCLNEKFTCLTVSGDR
jgi:hypothetical protein